MHLREKTQKSQRLLEIGLWLHTLERSAAQIRRSALPLKHLPDIPGFFLCSVAQGRARDLRRIRIHHAKLLLMEAPDMSLSKIAAACGFHSTSYFGKVFRQSSGMTPQAYRLGAVWRPPAVERPDPQKQ